MFPALPFLPAFLLLFSVLAPAPLHAQTAPADANPPAEVPPSAEGQAVYAEALQLMNQGKVDEALAKLAAMPAADASHSAVLNLKGALSVRKKDYPAAAAAFGKILEANPKNTIAHFNLGEVHFLQKDYPKAKALFTRFLQEPGNSQNALGRYKVFLCDLLGADPSAAAKTLADLEPTISHPFYYFANAAQAFKTGQADKAREYIQSAFGIYPGGLNAAFADSMVELGWLKPEEIAQIGAIDSAALQSLSSEFRPEKAGPTPEPAAPTGFENLLPDFAREPKPAPPAVQP